MARYVIEGRLHKDINKISNRIFVETEVDENGCPLGTWVDEVVDNIPENAKIRIVIDFE